MVSFTKKTVIALALMTSLSLTACDQIQSFVGKTNIQCNDDASKQHIQQMFLDSISEKNKIEVKNMVSEGHDIDLSRVNSIMSQLVVQLMDVRTVHTDEKSSKKLCEATLKVQIPSTLIDEADAARAMGERETVQQQALFEDLKFETNSLTYNIAYSVQPTDDGKKIYGSLENADKASNFISEIITDIIWKPVLEELNKQHEAELEAAQAQYEAEEQQKAQTRMEYIAVLEKEHKQNLEKANAKLNLVWNAATAETRQELLPEQKTWLKKRELECKLKAQDATNSDEKEVERLKCEISMTDSRTYELKSMIAQIEG